MAVSFLILICFDLFDLGAQTSVTKEERIAALEAEMAAMQPSKMTTTSRQYGIQRAAADPLETFTSDVFNIKKNPDLMPCPRRPPGKK